MRRSLGLIFQACLALCKDCPYSEFFWSVFSRIWTEYGEIRSISPYSVRVRENADQKSSKNGHFLRSVDQGVFPNVWKKPNIVLVHAP